MDDCVGVGSKEELDALANGINAKYRITGLGEARWMLGMLVKRPRYPDDLYFSRSVHQFHIILADATPVMAPLSPGAHLSAAD